MKTLVRGIERYLQVSCGRRKALRRGRGSVYTGKEESGWGRRSGGRGEGRGGERTQGEGRRGVGCLLIKP